MWFALRNNASKKVGNVELSLGRCSTDAVAIEASTDPMERTRAGVALQDFSCTPVQTVPEYRLSLEWGHTMGKTAPFHQRQFLKSSLYCQHQGDRNQGCIATIEPIRHKPS